MHIKQHLVHEAEKMTARPLPRLSTEEEVDLWRQKQMKKFQKAIGIDYYLNQPRTDLNIRRTGTVQRDGYRIETLYFESLPGVYVAGNLYIPDHLETPAPAILYLCGHSNTQKAQYQLHPRAFAKLGFVSLVIDTIQLGENHGYHHGTYRYGWFQWISRGYSPVGPEVWNAIRALDLLCSLPEVDPTRLGVTGNSGGGSIAWWAACSDERFAVMASSCGTGTLASHIRDNTIDTHCDCIFPNNPYGWSLIEMCALVAPRPVLIASPTKDVHFTIESVRHVHQTLRSFYAGFGAAERVGMVEFYGPHGYRNIEDPNEGSLEAIYDWFLQHLLDKRLEPGTLLPMFDDELKETEALLIAFKEGLPPHDESTTIQDWFIPRPELAHQQSIDALVRERDKLIATLRDESFSFFPDQPVPLQLDIRQEWMNTTHWHTHFIYNSEPDWQLSGVLSGNLSEDRTVPAPTAVYLSGTDETRRLTGSDMLHGLPAHWLKARLDVRGTGDTSWGDPLNNHIRRSAMAMGRTIAGMRVWDALRGIEAIRSRPEVNEEQIVLAARGEMAVIALYATLLDSRIKAIILEDPVDSLDMSDPLSGPASMNEIVNALRHTDLAHTAAMLYPRDIVFVKRRPDGYRYTEEQYKLLGMAGSTWRVATLTDWPGISAR